MVDAVAKPKRSNRNAERMRKSRADSKDVPITKLTPHKRRKRRQLEKDDRNWLRFFFPHKPYGFWYDFTPQQAAMIDAIGHAIRHGGDQAIAASRGEGKTQLTRRLTLKYILSGQIAFAVLFAATGSDAMDSLQAIRMDVEENPIMLEYYPEVCEPVVALENTPNRAHYQTVTGKRYDTGKPFERVPSRFSWCGHEIHFPNVPGSPSAGAIIATRGLDSAVRGLNIKGRRPDVAIIDDPDTEDTSRSEDQAKKLEDRIDRAIAGLGGQQRGIARVMLTTLQNRICVSYRFTDPAAKPTWKGKRFRFLLEPPKRRDLWDEYVQQVQTNLQLRDAENEPLDPFARGAHRFYLENREAMEEDAKVANPHRFDPADLGDGTRLEESALQRYFNLVARVGPEAVATEYDNDPPEETGIVESAITPTRIQKQVCGRPRREIPPGVTLVTQGIDVRKIALHWVVRGWAPDRDTGIVTGYTIDYGVTEVLGTHKASEAAIDSAIVRALRERREFVDDNPYATADGEVVPVSYSLVDSGWRTEAIYQFCDEVGLGWYPAVGHGRSSGCATTNFYQPTTNSPQKLIGWRYFLAMRPNGSGWLCHMDADHWKAWEHDRWMADVEKPGALWMWGEPGGNPERLGMDEKAHHSYARHICAETEVEEPDKNGVMKRYWKAKSDNNHWLDASYRANVAAAMAGARLYGMQVAAADEEYGDEGPIVGLSQYR